MQKPLASDGKGLAVQEFDLIVLQAPHQNQVFSEISNYIRDRQLTEAIRRRELTLSLEILEWYGFEGDLGILAISRLQPEEAA